MELCEMKWMGALGEEGRNVKEQGGVEKYRRKVIKRGRKTQ